MVSIVVVLPPAVIAIMTMTTIIVLILPLSLSIHLLVEILPILLTPMMGNVIHLPVALVGVPVLHPDASMSLIIVEILLMENVLVEIVVVSPMLVKFVEIFYVVVAVVPIVAFLMIKVKESPAAIFKRESAIVGTRVASFIKLDNLVATLHLENAQEGLLVNSVMTKKQQKRKKLTRQQSLQQLVTHPRPPASKLAQALRVKLALAQASNKKLAAPAMRWLRRCKLDTFKPCANPVFEVFMGNVWKLCCSL